MQKIIQHPFYRAAALLCFLIFHVQVGAGQSYSHTIFDNGTSTISINNFPDLICGGTGNLGIFTPSPGCYGSCLESVIAGASPSAFHIMDIGETINLSLTVTSQNDFLDFNAVIIDYVTNPGTVYEEVIEIIRADNGFGGGTSRTYNGSITPTSGSLNSAIVISVYGNSQGGQVLPMYVTGPVFDIEVPVLGRIITPQIPYMVLHDPPGDQSFARFEANTKICRSTSTSYETATGGGFNAAVKIGSAGTVGVVLAAGFEFSIGFSNQFNMTHTRTNTGDEEQCLEIIDGFSTSDLAGGVGADSDVFIGYGEELVWGVYDSVTYDGCTIGIENGLTYYPDTSKTKRFVKTASGIEADIAVQLAIANDPNNSTLVRDRAYNQVEVWQDVLAQNAANVASASQVIDNVSFDGGGLVVERSEDVTTTQVKTTSYDVAIENNSQINIVAIVGATGFAGGPEFNFKKNEGTATSATTSTGEMISYSLSDDEVPAFDSEGRTDNFSVTVYRDPAYGTPIFKLNDGSRTSCPYEGGFRRDQPRLSWKSNECPGEDVKVLEVVDDNDFSTPTHIFIQVCNDSDEENDYQLSVDGLDFNPSVTAGGGDLTNATAVVNFNEIAAGTCEDKLVTIKGNGNPGFDNHSLIFKLAPNCNTSPGASSDVVIAEADIIQLNISFEPGATYQETAYCDDADMDGISYLDDLCPDVSDTALEFDGVDDQVVIPHNSLFNILDQDFTMEAWVKPSGITNSETIISKGGLFIFQVQNNKIALFLLSTTGGQWKYSNTSLTLNEWNHVAVSFDFNTKTATFYLNGVPDGVEEYFPDSASPFNNTGTEPIYIGRQTSCNCNFMNGGIDDIIIWDRALDAMEINETINKPLAGTEAGLVVYYDFNDAAACAMSGVSTLVDKGPNSQDGTLTNFTPDSDCVSDWTSGRNLDSDGDGIGDACSNITCPPDYAGLDKLTGTISTNAAYESSGDIESDQVINAGSNVTYNAGTTVVLKPGFEAKAGSEFRAFIDGCTPPAASPAIQTPEGSPAAPVASSSIKVYPNPVADYSTIAIENEWRGETQVYLVSMLGRTTMIRSFEKTGDLANLEFDTSQLPKGYYKIVATNGAQLVTSTFVKM